MSNPQLALTAFPVLARIIPVRGIDGTALDTLAQAAGVAERPERGWGAAR